MDLITHKKTGTEQKLWIIGDSFTGMRHEHKSWQWQLYQSFIGNKIYVSSRGSRDLQSITDIFLRNLKYIKENDFVIIFLPTLSRIRLPLEEPISDAQLNFDDTDDNPHFEHFIGSMSYTPNDGGNSKHNNLEFPLNEVHESYWQESETDFLKTPNIIKFINSSDASIANTNEILNSLKTYVPFELYLVSWTNELDGSIIDTKDVITNNLEFWHTSHMEFLETNGERGILNDIHWSEKMDTAFAEYIIKKFPKYFN